MTRTNANAEQSAIKISNFKIIVVSICLYALAASSACGQIARELAQPLFEASCIACHDGSADNGLNLNKLKNDLTDPDQFRQWERIYDRVKSGEMPPESETRPDPEYLASALRSIRKSLITENKRAQSIDGRVILRRLTRTEYEHTLADLLYIKTDIGGIIPAENSSSSFDTVFSTQGFSPIHVQGYLKAADAALDAAIRLSPEPKSKVRRFEFLKSKTVQRHFDDEKSKPEPHPIAGKLDDAIVMFNDASYVYKLDHHVETSGWYKVRAQVYRHQSRDPVILTLNAGDYNRGFTKVLGWFDLDSDEPITAEVEAYLEKGQYLFPGVEGLKVQPNGKTIWNVGPKKYKGAGIAVRWVELEGPTDEQWPPYSTTNLLKDVKLKKLKRKRWDQRRSDFVKYEPVVGESPREQLERIIGWLAPRAFRRPLLTGEGTPFVELGLKEIQAGRSFEDAIRVSLRAALTSPNFLFMTPEPGPLDDFSLASRLSYFLWKSIPDHELSLSAKRQRITREDELDKQIDRMLDDEKSQRFISDFCNQWLQLSEIDATVPDKRLYPEFDELLKHSMLDETEYFIAHLIEKDLSVSNLIDSDFTFVNRRLAEHYGIPGIKGQTTRKVRLRRSSPRGGLLTQASILKVTANGTNTSPVLRGNWVLTHLLGTPPSPPPPTIGSIEPDTRGTTTIREMLEKHRSDPSCSSCHRLIDPPGFALECFDVIGGYRKNFRNKEHGEPVKEKLFGRNVWEYKTGLPVDASGELEDGQKFDGIVEYKKLLKSKKEQIARHLISQLVVYATGAEIQFADREEIDRIFEQCRASDFGLRTIIREIIKSKLFLNK